MGGDRGGGDQTESASTATALVTPTVDADNVAVLSRIALETDMVSFGETVTVTPLRFSLVVVQYRTPRNKKQGFLAQTGVLTSEGVHSTLTSA